MSPSRYDDELWELVADHHHDHDPPAHLREFVESLGPAERALDLGAGIGRLTPHIDAAVRTAADVSPVALEHARARLGPDDRVAELTPDAPLPFDDGAFDLVVAIEVLEHVRDIQIFLSEIRRVLRPGGELALTTPVHGPVMRTPDPLSPHLRFFTRRTLRTLLDELGFDVRSLERSAGTLLVRASR